MHLSVFHGILDAPLKNKRSMVSKKKNPLFVLGWDRKIHRRGSPLVIFRKAMMPNSDPRDRLFNPTLTLMIDSYNRKKRV